jgi:hypothetical protein
MDTDSIRKGLMDIEVMLKISDEVVMDVRKGRAGKEEAESKLDFIKSQMLKKIIHNENMIKRLRSGSG